MLLYAMLYTMSMACEIKIIGLCVPLACGRRVSPLLLTYLIQHIICIFLFAKASTLQENIKWTPCGWGLAETYLQLFKNSARIQINGRLWTRYFRVNKLLLSFLSLSMQLSSNKKKFFLLYNVWYINYNIATGTNFCTS